jgi:membrane protein YdbS with pleckstrin-like domain
VKHSYSNALHQPLSSHRAGLRCRDRVCTSGEAPAIGVETPDIAVARELVRDDEIIILLMRPSLLFIPLAAMGSIMLLLILTLGLALLAAKISWIGWTEQQAYALGIVALGLRIVWQTLEWFNRVYILTDRRIITRSGVLRVSVYETQLKRIQHTTVFMRLRERVFFLGTIGFATAGSDVFDTFWVMLRQPFAVHRTILDAIQRYGNHHSR